MSEQLPCRDSGPLGSITRLPGLMHFLAQLVQGHVATQSHLRQLPIVQERGDLVTNPIQPDDFQEPVWFLPVIFSITDRTPPICTLFPCWDPPNVVFRREIVTMRAQV